LYNDILFVFKALCYSVPVRVRVCNGECTCDRDAAMAAGAGGADPQRARAGGAVPAHVPGHHRAQAADRRRRPQGR
jgi:hypothetical protein